VEQQNREPIVEFDPSHPSADAEGFIYRANIDPSAEMVRLITASRTYEANLQVMNATKALAQRILEIGRR